MSRHKTKHGSGLLPYPAIEAASSGDVDAINAVLNHFAAYITVLAAKRVYDANGEPQLYVDEWVRRRLETKLIIGILAYDPA
jgi:hypothetical protein